MTTKKVAPFHDSVLRLLEAHEGGARGAAAAGRRRAQRPDAGEGALAVGAAKDQKNRGRRH